MRGRAPAPGSSRSTSSSTRWASAKRPRSESVRAICVRSSRRSSPRASATCARKRASLAAGSSYSQSESMFTAASAGCSNARPAASRAPARLAMRDRELRMQVAQLRLELLDALEEREHERERRGLQLEVVAQARGGAHAHHAFGTEAPLRALRGGLERAVFHKLAQHL